MTDYLLDANVLVALSDGRHIHHEAAHAWLDALAPDDTWLTCPMTEAALIRLLMNPAVTGEPGFSAATAIEQLSAMKQWAGDRHRFLSDDTTLADPVIDRAMVERSLVGYSQVTDFHLLNLASRHKVKLATLDRKLGAALPAEVSITVHIIPASLAEN